MSTRTAEEERIFERLAPEAGSLDLELIDVKFIQEHKKLFLRLYVDRRGGVTIDECVRMSEIADPIIDGELGIKKHDYFEVSSPGLDRPLTEIADFIRYAGSEVKVKLREAVAGSYVLAGKLLTGDLKKIELEHEGEIIELSQDIIKEIKRDVVFK